MQTIDEILKENSELMNKLVNAAFHQGYPTAEVAPAIASAVSTAANRAIFARAYASLNIPGLNKEKPDGPKD